MPHRSFTSPTGGEPVSFDLNGRVFHCIPRLPAGIGIDIAMGALGASGVERIGEFFQVAIVPDEADDFAHMIRDLENPIDMVTLEAILRYLVEAYTDRPTTPLPGSGNGQAAIVNSSTGAASSAASTSTPSPPTDF